MLLPVFAILAVLGLWLWWYYMASYLSSIPLATVSSIEAWGTFGDSFGSLNTLFTGLAFIGLVYTIHTQRKEMKETSEALKHEKKREAIRDFENTFFHLLELHTEKVRAIECDILKKYHGQEAIKQIHINVLLDYLRHNLNQTPTLEEGYSNFWHNMESRLGTYFKLLHSMIAQIDRVYISEKVGEFATRKILDKYIDLLLVLLSSHELALLFYHVNFCAEGSPDFKNLVEKYDILRALKTETLHETPYMSKEEQFALYQPVKQN